MTSSLPRAEYLVERNQLIKSLWEMDRRLRVLHATGQWSDPKFAASLETAMADRHALAAHMRGLGVAPWEWHPERDNSWIANGFR